MFIRLFQWMLKHTISQEHTLFRNHMLRTLKDIPKSSGYGVPASMCTSQWFIKHYLLHSAYPSYSRWQRINSLDDIDSSGKGTSKASEDMSAALPLV
jgi:hypothetical protein